VNTPIILHFGHRVLGMLALMAIVWLAIWVVRKRTTTVVRTWALLSAGLAVAQVSLGFLSVLTVLAVIPVSLHTLGAATLLAVLVHVATLTRLAAGKAPQTARAWVA
jgi:heme A synthase